MEYLWGDFSRNSKVNHFTQRLAIARKTAHKQLLRSRDAPGKGFRDLPKTREIQACPGDQNCIAISSLFSVLLDFQHPV